ncbi:MAG: hypothetical protein ACK4MJ_03965 [Hylemonella sp.]
MRVLIIEQTALPGQMLAPGVVADVNEATAAWLIDSGAAQAAQDAASAVAGADAGQDVADVADVASADAPRRRRKAQE